MVIRNRFAIPAGDEIDGCAAISRRRHNYLPAHTQLHIPWRYTIPRILRGLVVGIPAARTTVVEFQKKKIKPLTHVYTQYKNILFMMEYNIMYKYIIPYTL